MRKEYHLQKARNFQRTISKLSNEEDFETIIENCTLIAAHWVNAFLHHTDLLPVSRDIKHNLLPGFLRRQQSQFEDAEQLADLVQRLEDLRPGHIYGIRGDGDAACHARAILADILRICSRTASGLFSEDE